MILFSQSCLVIWLHSLYMASPLLDFSSSQTILFLTVFCGVVLERIWPVIAAMEPMASTTFLLSCSSMARRTCAPADMSLAYAPVRCCGSILFFTQRWWLQQHLTERHGWHLHPDRYREGLAVEVDEHAFFRIDGRLVFQPVLSVIDRNAAEAGVKKTSSLFPRKMQWYWLQPQPSFLLLSILFLSRQLVLVHWWL